MDATKFDVDGESYQVRKLDPLIASDLFLDLIHIFGPALGSLGSALLRSPNTKEAFAQLMDGVQTKDESGIPDLSEDGKEAVQALIGDGLERAITGAIAQLNKSKQREIIKLMMDQTDVLVDGKWPKLDSIFTVHFRGRPFSMYKWLAKAIQAQFKSL
jgi:hypothetical protein